jgi:K+-sensing histidine kinase KdpD
MQIKNSRAWAMHTPTVYGYALLGTLAAFFVRYQFHPVMQTQFPILFFLFNTTLIVYKVGWKPATMSAIIGLLLAYYFFIPPFSSFEIPTIFDLLNLLVYSILFITVIYLIEKLQRERYKAVLIARVSNARMQIMAKLSATSNRRISRDDALK